MNKEKYNEFQIRINVDCKGVNFAAHTIRTFADANINILDGTDKTNHILVIQSVNKSKGDCCAALERAGVEIIY
jgi:hypothetical protein